MWHAASASQAAKVRSSVVCAVFASERGFGTSVGTTPPRYKVRETLPRSKNWTRVPTGSPAALGYGFLRVFSHSFRVSFLPTESNVTSRKRARN